MKSYLRLCKGLFLLFLGIYGLSFSLQAQQIPLYSQYFHNQFIYNPAWAGLQPFGSANLTYRSQWVGMDNAPKTALFSYDMPFYEYRSGAGLTFYQDRVNVHSRYKIMGTYAYHIFGPYENSSTLSFGISGGMVLNRMNLEDLYVRHPTDPYIFGNSGVYNGFEVAFGLHYNFRNKVQIGLVAPQLLNAGLTADDENLNNLRLVNHFLFTLKGQFDFTDSKLEPMLMVRQVLNTPTQIEIGAQYTYRDLVRVSAAYRSQYAVTICAGFDYQRLSFGLARDFPISDLAGAVGSTNEIMIGYKFNFMPGADWAGKAGVGNGLIRKKKYHPSRPGPGMDRYPKQPKKKRIKGKYRRW